MPRRRPPAASLFPTPPRRSPRRARSWLSARADSHDLALRGLLLGGVGNNDAAGGLLLGIDALDDDAVVKRAEFHGYPPKRSEERRVGKECRSGWAEY